MSTRLRILVVEGQHTAGQAIAGLLRRRGHEVRLVSSAEDALACEPSDVLVSDLDLPGASGLALLRELRTMPHLSQVPIVAVTAQALTGDEARLLEAGFGAVLTKPINTSLLNKMLEVFLGVSSDLAALGRALEVESRRLPAWVVM